MRFLVLVGFFGGFVQKSLLSVKERSFVCSQMLTMNFTKSNVAYN